VDGSWTIGSFECREISHEPDDVNRLLPQANGSYSLLSSLITRLKIQTIFADAIAVAAKRPSLQTDRLQRTAAGDKGVDLMVDIKLHGDCRPMRSA
jgi:hypothetical protein